MKRKITKYYSGISQPVEGTIVIDKNGLRVDDIVPESIKADEIIIEFIKGVINSDGWYSSWHLSVENAKSTNSSSRKEIRKIINEDLEKLEKKKQLLLDAKNVLSRWHY